MGPSTLLVLAVGAVLAGITFNQVVSWDAAWTAWVEANFDEGMRDALGYLPPCIFIAQVLTVLAAAMPHAVAVRRG